MRVLLFHWNDPGARERAALLRRAGHVVVRPTGSDAGALRALRSRPPDAVVIDLSRAPSRGRDIAAFLRQQRATRLVPIVFAEGAPEKVARVRELFPGAVYATWRGIAGALRRALRAPPAQPAVAGALAGYAGTPLPRKLGITVGARVALVGAPGGFERRLGPLPTGAVVRRGVRGRPGVILLFVPSASRLSVRFPGAARALAAGGRLWILWPKRSSGAGADLGQNEVRKFGLGKGFVDYKICAVDETWSGLCFARRAPGRTGRAGP